VFVITGQKILIEKGYTVFLCDNIAVGDDFRLQISSNAASCKAFVMFINEPWCKSKECNYEFNIALKKSFMKGTPKLFPLILENFPVFEQYPVVDGFLCSTQGIVVPGFIPNEAIYTQILVNLASQGITPSGVPGGVPPPAETKSSEVPNVAAADHAAQPAVSVVPVSPDVTRRYEVFGVVNDIWLLNHLQPSEYKSISSNWGSTIAATYCKGFLWATTDKGTIYKISKAGEYKSVYEGWDVKVMATLHNNVVAVVKDIWLIDPETLQYKSISQGWEYSKVAVGHKDFVWVVTQNGKLYKVSIEGKYETISEGWGDTKALVSCGDYIYVFGNELRRIDPNTGAHVSLAPKWEKTIAATNFGNESMLAVTNSGSMYLVNPSNGSSILIENGWQETKILVSITD